MKISRGKQFEEEFKKAMSLIPNISIDRLPDPCAGYAGIRNICDFIVYQFPVQFYFECKAVSGNTLNFNGMVTKDQWDGLYEKSLIRGVCAGLVVWYIDHDITVFVPIQPIKQKRDFGMKSLNVKDIISGEIPHTALPGRKKKILFEYAGSKFLNDLSKIVMEQIN